jgi:HAD superfamily hydrolase (TIGR01509 family)
MAGFPAAVLCDMDGLLLDSERLAREAFVRACRDLGWEPDLEAYAHCIGSTYEGTRALLLSAYGADFPYDAIDERWSAHYHARLAAGPVPVKRGAAALLDYLAQREVPAALVTSTRRTVALEKLTRTGLAGYFAQFVCGGETERGKPDPEPYVAAALALGVAPGMCWALEDSTNGVRAAYGAGCTVFQVPDLVAPSDELRELGHRIVPSLDDVLAALKQLA